MYPFLASDILLASAGGVGGERWRPLVVSTQSALSKPSHFDLLLTLQLTG